MRKAASAFSPRLQAIRKGWNRWSDVWLQRQAMRRAVKSLTSSGLRAGFNTWSEAWWAKLEAKEIMMGVATSLRSRGLRAAFNGWSELASDRLERLRLLKSAASAISSNGLRKALNSWCEAAEEAASRKAAMGAAIAALRRKPLRAAYNTWVSYALDSIEAQQAMRKAASAFSPRLQAIRKGWNRWSDVASAPLPSQSGDRPHLERLTCWLQQLVRDGGGERRVSGCDDEGCQVFTISRLANVLQQLGRCSRGDECSQGGYDRCYSGA